MHRGEAAIQMATAEINTPIGIQSSAMSLLPDKKKTDSNDILLAIYQIMDIFHNIILLMYFMNKVTLKQSGIQKDLR